MKNSFYYIVVTAVLVLRLAGLARGSQLSLLTGDLDSNFGDLYASHSLLCSQSALQEFIDECQVKGADNVSPNLRLQSAVRLSICEFKEANVNYPDSCRAMKDDEDFQSCVHEFRESAQLWTTYSGHYRKLRSVCYEEAVPFIRKSILDLFFNVTKIYTDFQQSAMKSSSDTQAFQEDILAKFQAMVDYMDQSFADREQQRMAQERSFDRFHVSMVDRSRYVEDVWDHVSSEISVSSEKVDEDLSKTQDKLRTIFDYIDTQFSRISNANENLAAAHFEATQSISNDLMELSQNSKHGQLVLQDILEENLHKSLQINHVLHDTHLQMENVFDDIEKATRAIVANVTRELRDEAMTIFVVFQTTFETAFSQLTTLSQKVGQTIFSMDAVSLSLDSNLEALQERISDLQSFNVGSLLSPVISTAKVALGLILVFAISRIRQEQGAFWSAVFIGAATAYSSRAIVAQLA